jgi:hypothetical protein
VDAFVVTVVMLVLALGVCFVAQIFDRLMDALSPMLCSLGWILATVLG